MAEFTMPSLGADMDEGTLLEWLVAPGDTVARGDLVAVIQTEKSDVEIEVFEAGTVAELLVEPGTKVAVGTPLARIDAEGGNDAVDQRAAESVAAEAPAPASTPIPAPDAPAVRGGRGATHASIVLSPVVRHLAETRHLDLGTVTGTGPGGRITRADVERAAASGSRPAPPATGTPPSPRPTAEPTAAAKPRPTPASAVSRLRASPLARRRAGDGGLDLTSVVGTGPAGAIVARDLTTAPPVAVPVGPSASSRGDGKAGKASGNDRQQAMRTAIARLMSAANRDIPHYHVTSTIDLAAATAWLAERNAAVPPGDRILPAAVLLRATALAARDVPELNGWWRDDAFAPAHHVDLGTAISLRGGGVVTPTIAAADDLVLVDLMAALRDLVARSRRGNLRGRDLAPASLTVTNLGEQGAEEVLGVIHPPQVALIGFGRPVDRVVAIDGQPEVRTTVRATVSGDHRATDGHAGSRFLAALATRLAAPDQL